MKASPPPKTPDGKSLIFLVDDSPIVRLGLTCLINQEKDLQVCGEASEPMKALQAIEALKPHLVVLDLSLTEASGLELIKSIRTRHSHLPILVLSMHSESLYAERALRHGANGYLMKHKSPERILEAIRKILKGDVYLSEEMSGKILHLLVSGQSEPGESPIASLSDRELEVFELIGLGHGTRQIADLLSVSIKTVESHREHIKQKLQLANTAELAQQAFEWIKAREMQLPT